MQTPFTKHETVRLAKPVEASIYAPGAVLTVERVHNDGTATEPVWCVYARGDKGAAWFPANALIRA